MEALAATKCGVMGMRCVQMVEGIGKSKQNEHRVEREAPLKNGAIKTWITHKYSTTVENLAT